MPSFMPLSSPLDKLFISFEESAPKLPTLPSEFSFTDVHDLALGHGFSSCLYNALVAYVSGLVLAQSVGRDLIGGV